MDTWGLGYEVLHTLNPRLIYATASALGPVGPDAAMEGADLTGQVMGGLIATTGMDGGPVTPVGAVITDHCGAQNLVTGILAALFHRERTGQGQRVDVSLLGGQIWAQASEYSHLFLCGQVAGRANRSRSLHLSRKPAGNVGPQPGTAAPRRARNYRGIGCRRCRCLRRDRRYFHLPPAPNRAQFHSGDVPSAHC